MRTITYVLLSGAVLAALPLLIRADKSAPTKPDVLIAAETFDYSEGTPTVPVTPPIGDKSPHHRV